MIGNGVILNRMMAENVDFAHETLIFTFDTGLSLSKYAGFRLQVNENIVSEISPLTRFHGCARALFFT